MKVPWLPPTWHGLAFSLAIVTSAAVAEVPGDQSGDVIDKVTVVERTYRTDTGLAGQCDVYSPARGDTSKPSEIGNNSPVVLVIHGGGWATGDKWTMSTYCRNLADAGFVAVSINYRHAPEFKFPAQADDIRAALLWLAREHESLHIDLSRVGLFGYSAGGHLASLIGLAADSSLDARTPTSSWSSDDERWQQLPQVKAICAGGPPCDFRTLPPDNTAMAYFLGGSQRELPEVYAAASPITHITPADPPMQIIHGDQDIIVPYLGSLDMLAALQKAGVDSQLTKVPGQGHMVTFVHPLTNETMLKYFKRILR